MHGGYGGSLVRVDGFRFGVSMMTRQVIVYAWTFRGQLVLSVNYNEAYHGEDVVRNVLERMKSCLEGGLGGGF